MKKIYTAIIIIALALFISCDDKKAKDAITKAIDETVAETVAKAENGTSLANNVQGNTQSKTKTIQVIQGKVQVTEGEAGSRPEDTPEPESETPLTKPALSAQRVRWETPITFQKVEGHTYRLKDNKQGFVSLGDVSENIHQVKATQVVVDVVVVATKGSEQIESDPIDFLLHVANKVALQAEIEVDKRLRK